MPSRSPRYWAVPLVAAGLGIAAIVYTGMILQGAVLAPHANGSVSTIVPGVERRLVFIGAPDCASSTHPVVIRAVRQLIQRYRHESLVAGNGFSTLGVSVSWEVTEGVRFLDDLTPFDEIAVGRNWLNEGATRYIWRDLPGTGAVPQVVVVSREIGVAGNSYILGPDRVELRLTGGREIVLYTATLLGEAPPADSIDGATSAGGPSQRTKG